MSMGSTGTVNVSPEMLTNALSAVDDYRTEVQSLHTQINAMVGSMIPQDFSGSAADGFMAFYTNNIEPATGDGVNKLLDAMDAMLNGILQAIPAEEGVDEQLGDGNKGM